MESGLSNHWPPAPPAPRAFGARRTCFDAGSPAGEGESEREDEREGGYEGEDEREGDYEGEDEREGDYEGEDEDDYEGEREGGRIAWCDYGERFSFAHTRRCREGAPAFRPGAHLARQRLECIC